MKYCPYAQRTRMVLFAKNIDHEIVNVNLKHKPDWFLQRTVITKVPVLEKGDNIIYESLITCDFLEDIVPHPSMYPADSWQKAKDKVFIELSNRIIRPLIRIIYRKDAESIPTMLENMKKNLYIFETELKQRNTIFFRGNKPGMLDYMLWPWIERLPVLKLMAGEVAAITKEEYPKLCEYMENMKKDEPVKKTYISPEEHAAFFRTLVAGEPDYDLEFDESKSLKSKF